MQSISVNIICRNDRPKGNLYPLYCRIIMDRQKIDIRIKHYVEKQHLLPNGSVPSKLFNSWVINNDIQHTLNEVNKIFTFYRSNGTIITKNNFNLLFRKKIDTTSLHRYIITESALMAICINRLYSYRALAHHIEKYFPAIKLNDCNYNFIVELEKVFLFTLHFKQNTVTSFLTRLKAILNIAFKRKLIPENPFIYYKVKGFTSNREFLTKNEVLKIEQYYNDCENKSLKNVAAIFLFLCYTGLRIGDFTKLRFSNIVDNCIEHITNKTRTKNTIPLSLPALRFVGATVFNFYHITDVKINKGLKEIAKSTAITKPLSCHVARHTFATLSLEFGMELTTISKILGHSKISTTMIYAKVLDATKKKEIAKWDGFFG